MHKKICKTNDVFGVNSQLIGSYIERTNVDDMFKLALEEKKQIIVYGSSKQGKTSLILKHLSQDKYIKVECSPQTKPVDIYRSVLRQLGIRFTDSETYEKSTEAEVQAKTSFQIKVPFFSEAETEFQASGKNAGTKSRTESTIQFNLELPQDISELLLKQKTHKIIILENFHYLSQEVQQTLAYDLRVFQDQGIIFIILGIWREANRLIQFNGDLLDRVIEVPVEPWAKEDFEKVIDKGSDLLNVDFSEVQANLLSSSFDSIGVVQELCKHCCINASVNQTTSNIVKINSNHLEQAIAKKSEEYGARHVRNFESFVDIPRKTSNQSGKLSLAFPYYFIILLLKIEFPLIEKGLSRAKLLEEIRRIHHRPDDVRSSDIGTFLHNITQHQINKKIQPPFVDYDRGNKMVRLIDSTLYFFLQHSNRAEIIEDIPNPISDDNPLSQLILDL
jgi:hypothetical protein